MRHAFTVAALALLLPLASHDSRADETVSGTPRYSSPEEARASLDKFCNPEVGMKTRGGQELCMQETYGQAYSFALSFFQKFSLTDAKLDEWKTRSHKGVDQATGDRNYLNGVSYGKTCSALLDSTLNIAPVLDYQPETALGLPRYCVDTALNLSGQFNIPVNTAEGSRLQTHIKWLEDYYKENPIPKAGPFEEKKLPQPL